MGDFILQFDKIHALKFKNASGLFLHVLIIFDCLALFCWPYLGRSDVWLFLIFVCITHYAQDWAKIKFTSQSKHGLFFFILDQVLHIAFISMIFLTDLRYMKAPWNESSTFLSSLYSNNVIALYVIGLIAVSYVVHFMILLVKEDYLKMKGMISVFEKRYGFLERIIIFSAVLLGRLWLIAVPVILALRPLLYKTAKGKLNVSSRFASWQEIVLSGAGGILTGLIFCMFI